MLLAHLGFGSDLATSRTTDAHLRAWAEPNIRERFKKGTKNTLIRVWAMSPCCVRASPPDMPSRVDNYSK
jgi:hypothetical protein